MLSGQPPLVWVWAVPAGTRWEFGVELLSQILSIAMEMAASAGSM